MLKMQRSAPMIGISLGSIGVGWGGRLGGCGHHTKLIAPECDWD